MGVDSTTIAGLLKRVYKDGDVENIQNQETETWKKLKKSPKKPAGDGFYGPATLEGNQRGQGSQNELEALRTPASQVPQQYKISPKVFSHIIRFSGLSADIAKGNEESFADNITYQYEEGMKDSAKELNAQLFRDGSGKVAQVNGAVSASASVTFDNGVPTHFKRGMYVDMINGSAVKQIDSIEVTDVDISAGTITLASAQTCDDDSWIYRENTADNAPTDGKEIAGLPLVTDDGTLLTTYQNISRSTYPQYDGITIDASSVNISNDLLNRTKARMKVLGGKSPKKICSNTSQMRKYLDIVTPTIRHETDETLDSQKVPVPTWNGMEWICDTDCGFGDVYMWDPSHVLKFELRPLKLDDSDGKTVKWDSGYDAFVSYLKWYGNVGTTNPLGAARLKSLAEPTF